MKTLAILAVAVLTAGVSTVPAASPQRTSTLEVLSMEEPVFPQTLIQRSITSGQVEAVVSIDHEGKTLDSLITAYTDPAFETLAGQMLPTVRFRLPGGVDGKNPVRARIQLTFETKGVVISQTVGDSIDSFLSRSLRQQRIDKLSKASELDRRLVARHTVIPGYPAGIDTLAPADLAVTLEFLVDETGRVRMPVLHKGASRPLADAAADALLGWQFEPPTRAGKPAIVSVRQEFVFTPPPAGAAR